MYARRVTRTVYTVGTYCTGTGTYLTLLYIYSRRRLAYPLFERSRPRNVCGRFGRATASTEKLTVMIPSNCAWRPPLSMHILMGVQRIVSVRAVAPQNLIDKKSCERERFTMRMSAAAQCCRRGAVVGLYGQRGPLPCSRTPR